MEWTQIETRGSSARFSNPQPEGPKRRPDQLEWHDGGNWMLFVVAKVCSVPEVRTIGSLDASLRSSSEAIERARAEIHREEAIPHGFGAATFGEIRRKGWAPIEQRPSN